jgi:hypothetical protein
MIAVAEAVVKAKKAEAITVVITVAATNKQS